MKQAKSGQQQRQWSQAAIFGALLSACALLTCGDGTDPPPKVDRTGQIPQPAVEHIGPSTLSAGQDVSVGGRGFVDPSLGRTMILLEGTYDTAAGGSLPARFEAEGKYAGPGMVTFFFGPNIPFSADNQLGTFRGSLVATNIGNNGTTLASPPVSVKLDVGPSIVLRQFRPAGAGCDPGLTATTSEQKFIIEVEAVGFTAGTDQAPLRFTYGFLRENFQFRGYVDGKLGVNPEQLFPPEGGVIVTDLVTQGTVSTLGNGVPRQVHVSAGRISPDVGQIIPGTIDASFGLTDLYTAAVTHQGASSYDATITVAVVDGTGRQTQRAIFMRVHNPLEVYYDGNEEVVRTFDAEAVSGCLSGGDVGVNVNYSESRTETRQRKFMVKGTGAGNMAYNFWVLKGQLSAELGFEVESTVSSAEAIQFGSSVFIVPGQFAVWYRQTIQLEKRAQLIEHGPCGHKQILGEAIVTDWVWSADLAKTNTGRCPPLPQSRLSPGRIYKPEALQ